MEALHEKRRHLNNYLYGVIETIIQNTGSAALKVITPSEPGARGCQVSLLLKQNGLRVYEQLMQRKFMVDWREPDVIRIAPVPFYNTFEEICHFGKNLSELILET
jgi:kynureninase